MWILITSLLYYLWFLAKQSLQLLLPDCEVSAWSNIFSKLDLPERDLCYRGAERDNQADSPADNIINTRLNLSLSPTRRWEHSNFVCISITEDCKQMY